MLAINRMMSTNDAVISVISPCLSPAEEHGTTCSMRYAETMTAAGVHFPEEDLTFLKSYFVISLINVLEINVYLVL